MHAQFITEVVLFHWPEKKPLSGAFKSIKDLTRMLPASQFLAEEKRKDLLLKIKELSGLESSRYESLCAVLIETFVNYAQSLPESANSYYSQSGGVVDHALNRTEAALSLFQEFMVQDQPDLLSEEQKLWQYALYSAAILQGIGKLYVDYQVNLFDINGQLLTLWNPLLNSLIHTGSYYAFEFQKESDVEFRRRINLLIARHIMPNSGFEWIASNPQVLTVWLALLNEDQRSAGTLGAILIRADAIAIQRYLNEYLARIGINPTGPLGRAGTFSGGVPESIADKEKLIGAEFILWLTKSLDSGRLMINKAPLFMVPGGLLMTQEMFALFLREHPEYKNWQAVQRGLLSWGLHARGADGNVISRFEQTQNQQMHNGIVFSGFAAALPGMVEVYHLSSGRVESMSATELSHRAQSISQFTQEYNAKLISSLEKLTASGQWIPIEIEEPRFSLGARSGG